MGSIKIRNPAIDKSNISHADIISSNISIFKDNIKDILIETTAKKPRNLYDLLWLNQVYTSTVLVRNSELLFFSEDPNLITVEDYGLWINLMINGYKFDFISSKFNLL